MPKSALPRKRPGLEGKMKSWYPGLPAEERLALVQRLFDERKVTESEGLLKYPL